MLANVKIKQFIPIGSIDPKYKKFKKNSSPIYILISFTCKNFYFFYFIVFLIDQSEQNKQTLEVLSNVSAFDIKLNPLITSFNRPRDFGFSILNQELHLFRIQSCICSKIKVHGQWVNFGYKKTLLCILPRKCPLQETGVF